MRRSVMLVGVAALATGLLAGPAMAQEFYVSGLTVEKVVEGDAPDGAEFAFALSCDDEDEYSQDFVLEGGESQTFEDAPQGATCTLTETAAEGADFESDDFFTPEPTVASLGDTDADWDAEARTLTFTIPDTPDEPEPHIGVTFTNDFGEEGVLGSGELVVSKRVSGDAEGPWEFEVICPGSVQDTVSLDDGESATFNVTRLPDTTCTITELDPGGADVAHSIDGGDEVDGAEASFVFDDGSVDTDVLLVREVEFVNSSESPDEPEQEDETAVLASTGFEATWGLVLAAGLLIPGAGALVYARKRDRREA